jgi:hypothetical protein
MVSWRSLENVAQGMKYINLSEREGQGWQGPILCSQ